MLLYSLLPSIMLGLGAPDTCVVQNSYITLSPSKCNTKEYHLWEKLVQARGCIAGLALTNRLFQEVHRRSRRSMSAALLASSCEVKGGRGGKRLQPSWWWWQQPLHACGSLFCCWYPKLPFLFLPPARRWKSAWCSSSSLFVCSGAGAELSY